MANESKECGCFSFQKLFRRKKVHHNNKKEVAEFDELRDKLAERENCLEVTAKDLVTLRNQSRLLEGLYPLPEAKENKKQERMGQRKVRHNNKKEVAEFDELRDKLAERENCLEVTAKDLVTLRNQSRLLEGLYPLPEAKENKKQERMGQRKVRHNNKKEVAEFDELRDKLAERENCLEVTAKDLVTLRNQSRLLEGLYPLPEAKENKKQERIGQRKVRHNNKKEVAEFDELRDKLAERENCLEVTAKDLVTLRNQSRLLEGLYPLPEAKENKKQERMGQRKQTKEAATQVEIHEMQQTIGNFQYAKENGQALEHPMLHIPDMDFSSCGYGTWVPTVQADSDDTMGPNVEDNFQLQPQLNPYERCDVQYTEEHPWHAQYQTDQDIVQYEEQQATEVVSEFEYVEYYGQALEQPMLHTPDMDFSSCGYGTWVPTVQADTGLHNNYMGPIVEDNFQLQPQLNPYERCDVQYTEEHPWHAQYQTDQDVVQYEEQEATGVVSEFENVEDYGQALEQPMLHIPDMDFSSCGYGTWVPTVQADTGLHNNYMGPIVEDNFQLQPQLNPYERCDVQYTEEHPWHAQYQTDQDIVQYEEQQATEVVSEFEYVEYYGQALEQPMLHTPDMDFSSCGYGTWVPTVQADTGLHNNYMGPIVEDNFQLQPQLNPYERCDVQYTEEHPWHAQYQTDQDVVQYEEQQATEVVSEFEYVEYYGQALEQPMLHTPDMDFSSCGYGTWVPTVQADTGLHNNYMGPIVEDNFQLQPQLNPYERCDVQYTEEHPWHAQYQTDQDVVQYEEQQATEVVAEFEYVEYYGQALEQPMLHTPDMDFSSCGYGTWLPTVQADTGLHNNYMGPIVEDNFQLQPQLNPYERCDVQYTEEHPWHAQYQTDQDVVQYEEQQATEVVAEFEYVEYYGQALEQPMLHTPDMDFSSCGYGTWVPTVQADTGLHNNYMGPIVEDNFQLQPQLNPYERCDVQYTEEHPWHAQYQTDQDVVQYEEQEATGVVSEFENVEYYGQALEQPMLHIPDMDFSSCGYGTWVPTVQADTGLHNNYMGPIVEDNFQLQPQLNPYERCDVQYTEEHPWHAQYQTDQDVVQYEEQEATEVVAEFEYVEYYGQALEQPMLHTPDMDFSSCGYGTWVPTVQADTVLHNNYMGPIVEDNFQLQPQLNPYERSL